MEIKKDKEEQFIKEALEREAEEIFRENAGEGAIDPLPEGVKERIRKKLQEDIEQYEWERRYPSLSDDERRALKLGQEMEKEMEMRRGKKSPKLYLILAAALLMALGASITSMGGPERIVQLVKSVVGGREVTRVNSGEDNLVIIEEDEEEAYETIKEELGINPVRMVIGALSGMQFEAMEFDQYTQAVELIYTYKDEKAIYFINAAYADSSWGVGAEDKVTAQYTMERRGCAIEVTEYETLESGRKWYEAEFRYGKTEYRLVGTMEKEEFEKIIENFYFIS